MKKRTLLILSGIFIALAVAALYSWWASYLNFGGTASFSPDLDFSVFTESATRQISVAKKGDEEKTLTKENGLWKANGLDASKKEVDDFFNVLAGLKIESLASKNPENHKNFEATEEDGTILSLYRGDVGSIFIVGKRGPFVDSFYAKTRGSSHIYLVSGLLPNKLSQNIAAWQEKREETSK